ncbi:MAG: endonuclease/exonuclease/phosphatase family protein [Myxococcales bacterium]|jgi:endonuclease/exonuclease/phosphatase family metal-dependent hydrolase
MDSLRVVTLNIWNDRERPARRLELIAEGLFALELDLIGLQEVREGKQLAQATMLARRLGMDFVFDPVDTHSAGGPVGNAILSRFPIEKVERYALPSPPHDPRRAVQAVVRTPAGEVQFTCCHLSWEPHMAPMRERQVLALDEITHAPPEIHAILVGDFNASPDAKAIRFLTGLDSLEGRGTFFRDTFARRHRHEDGFTWSSRNPFAVRWIEQDRRIDYVFVRGAPTAQGERIVEEARVVLDQPGADGCWPSDHFGVFASIRARGQTG